MTVPDDFGRIDWEAVTTNSQRTRIEEFIRVHSARVTGFARNVAGSGSIKIIYSCERTPSGEQESRRYLPEWAEVTYGPRGGIKTFTSSWDERRKVRHRAQAIATGSLRRPRIVADADGNQFIRIG